MPGIHLHMHLQFFSTADYHPALAQSLPNLLGHMHPPFTCRHSPPLCLFPRWTPVFLATGPNTAEVLGGFWATTAQREGVLHLWVSPVLLYFKQKALMLDRFLLLSWERLPPYAGQARVGKIGLKNKCRWMLPAVPRSILSFTTAGLGTAPHLSSFLQRSWLPKHQCSPPTSGNTSAPATLRDVLGIRKHHTSAAYLSLHVR